MSKPFKTKLPLTRPIETTQFKIKRQITLPIWRWEDAVPKYFRIDGKMHQGKAMATRGKEKGQMEPATVAPVTNLENGLACQIIVGAMLKGTLEDNFPNDSYVGRSFTATQTAIEGKRYKSYSLAELDV